MLQGQGHRPHFKEIDVALSQRLWPHSLHTVAATGRPPTVERRIRGNHHLCDSEPSGTPTRRFSSTVQKDGLSLKQDTPTDISLRRESVPRVYCPKRCLVIGLTRSIQ